MTKAELIKLLDGLDDDAELKVVVNSEDIQDGDVLEITDVGGFYSLGCFYRIDAARSTDEG